jgi:hypothetical protein
VRVVLAEECVRARESESDESARACVRVRKSGRGVWGLRVTGGVWDLSARARVCVRVAGII